MANRLIRAGFARRTQPDGSRRLALGHIKAPLHGIGATARRHRRSPAEAQGALAGERSEPGGSVSVGHMHCSVESGSRAETAAGSNYFPGMFRGSSPPTRPGETSQNLMQIDPPGADLPNALPQLKRRERAAHTATVSEQGLATSGQSSRGNSNGFRS
jgi:hypothetical protein